MEIYCLEEFKTEYDKLKKNNSYKDLEKNIINFFFGKHQDDFFKTGTLMNGSHEIPFIKMRIKGSGGWRFYYLLIINKGKLYLMFLHPKTGSSGASNITSAFAKSIYNTVLKEITANNLYTLSVAEGALLFKHNLLKSAGKESSDKSVKVSEEKI